MSTKYRVCNNRSVCLPDGKLLRSGEPLPTGVKKNLVAEWVTSGFVYQAGQNPNPVEENPPAVPNEGPLGKAKKAAKQEAIVLPIKTKGKYNYSPGELADKTLEELNLLLVDLDTDPADTEEEAIALLSSDYKG